MCLAPQKWETKENGPLCYIFKHFHWKVLQIKKKKLKVFTQDTSI